MLREVAPGVPPGAWAQALAEVEQVTTRKAASGRRSERLIIIAQTS
jgi:hypothetical protein